MLDEFEKTIREIQDLNTTGQLNSLTTSKSSVENPIGKKEIKHLEIIARNFFQRIRDFQKMHRHHYGPKGPNAENY
ncbi:MAG: hypothetical protein A3J63_01470 [Candidatus Moranbacteria bacterium RIFCSPHIGHO2_02_FULL_40_12b]|nr:MAG: hypothetical protein A3J63_01470 [Candidatus Moranbacteria bacterium RIFCSPHIGHO2_02_FULL_40_12b]